MQRVTMTIEDDQLAALDAYAGQRGYASRSEAMRDVLAGVQMAATDADSDATCIATLTYLFDHDIRDLTRRLATQAHSHHHLQLSTLHVHITHDDCLEVVVLRGTVGQVRRMADAILTQKGVRMGQLHVMPLPVGSEAD
ncbi:nickel-responsive transcriptional regulator NikR [Paracoccus nototheniae]|uniref:Putative nickel-responsive regulator n=1 Tax=Paracoccus nototheniae TaxID=2489002 RepID=A0ABW4E207_9RHOB|nr:nickel-responsive transcriptional regulator NikR [Paracoccus nototheniae]